MGIRRAASAPHEGLEDLTELGRDRHRGPPPLHGVVDVDVDEAALGTCLVPGALEDADAVDDRGGAQPFDRQAELDRVGEAELLEVAAPDLGHDADGGQRADVGAGGLDEVGVDGGVDELEVGGVVHVPVDVVVGPPRRGRAPRDVVAPGRARPPFAHAGSASRSRWLITVVTPSPRMVTPYSASPISIVRFWWVITSSWE